eukprot:356244-Chlamydomonas_euryale.AAC.6
MRLECEMGWRLCSANPALGKVNQTRHARMRPDLARTLLAEPASASLSVICGRALRPHRTPGGPVAIVASQTDRTQGVQVQPPQGA